MHRALSQTRSRTLSLACAALSLCWLALPNPAAAGPVEQLVQVALHPSDPDTILLRYKFGGEGLFVSHDAGATWGLVCNTFIDPSTSARNGVAAVGGDGALMLGVFDGLWQADDGGCSWELTAGVGKRWVADVAADPDDPEVLYAVTANGGDGITNGVLRRGAGDSWSELGGQEALMIFRMRVVSTGAGLRFVQSATRGMLPRTIEGVDTMVPNYVIRVSDDDAESFQEFPFEAPDDGSFYLAGVDPSNPDRIVAYIDRDETGGKADPVLVSLDGGQSFEPYLEVTDFAGVAITTDGKVFIADRGSLQQAMPKGLWSAASLEEAPNALFVDRGISCLGYQSATDTLYGCELRAFGKLDQATGEFTRLLKFDEVQSMVECAGVDVPEACRAQLCRDYCLLGHFPDTPLCEVYQGPTCGPCSNEPPGPLCHMDMGGAGAAGGTAGAAGAAAGTGASSAGAGAGMGGGGATGGAAGTGAPEEPDDDGGKKKDSGCTVARPGADTRSTHALHALTGLALVFGATRRKRRRAR